MNRVTCLLTPALTQRGQFAMIGLPSPVSPALPFLPRSHARSALPQSRTATRFAFLLLFFSVLLCDLCETL